MNSTSGRCLRKSRITALKQASLQRMLSSSILTIVRLPVCAKSDDRLCRKSSSCSSGTVRRVLPKSKLLEQKSHCLGHPRASDVAYVIVRDDSQVFIRGISISCLGGKSIAQVVCDFSISSPLNLVLRYKPGTRLKFGSIRLIASSNERQARFRLTPQDIIESSLTQKIFRIDACTGTADDDRNPR